MNHFTAVTALSLFDGPKNTDVWQKHVPFEAGSNPMLMHGLLAVAALHLATTTLDCNNYYVRALHHHSLGLQLFKNQITHPSTCTDSSDALFTFSVLLVVWAFAAPVVSNNSLAIDDILNSLGLIRGCKTLFLLHHETILDRPVGRILEIQPPTEAANAIPVPSVLGDVFRHLQSMAHHDHVHLDAIEDLQRIILKALNPVTGPHNTNLVAAWPAAVSDEYWARLRRHEPVAVLIFLHYAVLLQFYEDQYWWMAGCSRSIVDVAEGSLTGAQRDGLGWTGCLERIVMLKDVRFAMGSPESSPTTGNRVYLVMDLAKKSEWSSLQCLWLDMLYSSAVTYYTTPTYFHGNPITWRRVRLLSTIATSTSHDDHDHYIRYHWINGAEELERYEPGGYHPVMIGDKLHNRYSIVDKLGYGGYSTVWLARDTETGHYVALKVGTADSDSVTREINTLRCLASPGHEAIPTVLDDFELEGPNGRHRCYSTSVAACNLQDASFSELFPIDVARAISGRLVLAVAYLHENGFVHGDLHLRNILVKLPSSLNHLSIQDYYTKYGQPGTEPVTRRDGKALPPNVPQEAVTPVWLGKHARDFNIADTNILLSDFGETFAPHNDKQKSLAKDCHTPLAHRPPEARFAPTSPLSYPADIWSLALAIWEILGMQPLFSAELATEDNMICQHLDALGAHSMPESWWNEWTARSKYFDEGREPKERREVWPRPLEESFEEDIQDWRYREAKFHPGVFGPEEAAAIVELMRKMLVLRPEGRITIREVLTSRWMVGWVVPELERRWLWGDKEVDSLSDWSVFRNLRSML
ncbi:uncharacterized protein DSM5745_00812 [Aspergillus mulundensis]|uniref:Protein kinase domain-containing protein n=1 Tax=Aspergillus mulundensis TaxID=1810919 RepID=A0A3D8T4M5_9EURO|nr:hypothetical protein DSM5745_00812 [Aspergillus mulundensis]RDW93490.1 hypothetical protein DSM5745_00812 [Aspergillus mulundensis]